MSTRLHRFHQFLRKRSIPIIVIFLLAIIGYAVYLLAKPIPYTYLDNIIVSTDPIVAGRFERYSAKTCENEGRLGAITRNIVLKGTDIAPITVGDVPTRPIMCENIIFLPSSLPTGEYEILLDITFKSNSLRNAFNPVKKVYRSEPFTIVNPDPDNVVPPETQDIINRSQNSQNRQNQDNSPSPAQQTPGNVQQPSQPPSSNPNPPQQTPNQPDQNLINACVKAGELLETCLKL